MKRLRDFVARRLPPRVVDATDFGVDPASPDNGPALRRAVRSARGRWRRGVVVVPGGEVRLRGSVTMLGDQPVTLCTTTKGNR